MDLISNKMAKVAMVSTYPPFKDGVGQYTYHLYKEGFDNKNDVIILANKGSKSIHYANNISRVWSKNIFVFPTILYYVSKSNAKVVHFQHEFFLYGGVFSATTFPFLLFLVKLLGKKVIVTIHGVPDINEVDNEFLKENFIIVSPVIARLGFLLILKLISVFSDDLIVHEDVFRQRLIYDYNCNSNKISVIPHGVHLPKKCSRRQARTEFKLNLGKKYILCFGYLTGYKGIDLLIDQFNILCKRHKNWVLVVAGSKPLRMQDNLEYEKWYACLIKKIRSNSQIRFIGHVPDKKVDNLFHAIDVVIIPYTRFISSSGPLCLAIGAKKPFILSKKFKGIGFDELCYDNIFQLEDLLIASTRKPANVLKNRTFKRVAEQHRTVWFS